MTKESLAYLTGCARDFCFLLWILPARGSTIEVQELDTTRMPTLITHALVGGAAAQAAKPGWQKWRFATAAVVCSVLPDLDVVGFRLGIHYGDLWGHRGMMHSLVFAILVGGAIGLCFGDSWRERGKSAAFFSSVIALHDILDAFTSGGLGIAFFAPFSNQRYFFPWTPIRVSPIGLRRFLSPRGVLVMWNEIRWVWIPAFIGLAGVLAWRSRTQHRAEA